MDSERPWSEKVCELACLAFALWTVVCNVVVTLKGSLKQLMLAEACAFGALGLLGVVVFAVRRRRRSRATPPGVDSAGAPELPPRPLARMVSKYGTLLPRSRQAAVFLTVLALVVYPGFSRIEIFWWLALGIFALGLFGLAMDPERVEVARPRRDRTWEAMLWGLALAAVAFNLFVHRPDTDDSLYLNLAATAADRPDEPMMVQDRMHGIEGLAFHDPVYLNSSIEPLWGMFSYLTGIPGQLWFHVVHAALGALFIVLAYAALFRLLAPDRWLLAVLVLLVILGGAGGPQNHWYGNLAFVRVWQGKCTFLHVFLPLTFAYSMRFGLRPSLHGWLLMAAAQIAAVGMSSSAIWVEPLAAGVGLLCGAFGRGLRGWLRVLIGACSSLYILGVGFRLKALMKASAEKILREDFRLRDYSKTVGFQEVLDSAGQALDWGWKNVMGEGLLLYLCLGATLISWTVCRHALARRLAILLPLLTFLFIMNPYAEKLVMANLTGAVYYRSTWLLPIPVFMTLFFLSALDIDPARIPRRMMVIFMVVLLAGYVTRVSDFNPYHRANGVFYGRPGAKIFPEVNQAIRESMDVLPSGARIIAPTALSFWFPTYHRPLYPVVVNKWYTYVRGRELTMDEVRLRIALTEYVSGEVREDDFPDRFRNALDDFGIQGVIIDHRGAWRREIASILEEERFDAQEPFEYGGEARYQLWVRPADDPGVLNAPAWRVVALRTPGPVSPTAPAPTGSGAAPSIQSNSKP